jgi:hypothetical protein
MAGNWVPSVARVPAPTVRIKVRRLRLGLQQELDGSGAELEQQESEVSSMGPEQQESFEPAEEELSILRCCGAEPLCRSFVTTKAARATAYFAAGALVSVGAVAGAALASAEGAPALLASEGGIAPAGGAGGSTKGI